MSFSAFHLLANSAHVRLPRPGRNASTVLMLLLVALMAPSSFAGVQDNVAWSAAERPLHDRLSKLRDVPDDRRGAATVQLAQDIGALPASANKLQLAVFMAAESTEGDYGQNTTQAAADTLTATMAEHDLPFVPLPASYDGPFNQKLLPAYGYKILASLVRYEHVTTTIGSDSHFRAELERLDLVDQKRQHLDFSLKDLNGKVWTLAELRGKVVLLNFWATWCPPCRKEIPDLGELQNRFAAKGLVVLGVTDEPKEKVSPFVEKLRIPYPVLLDPQHEFETKYGVGRDEGIPKSFVYDRSGKIVAQANDARSMRQFLTMLETADISDGAP